MALFGVTDKVTETILVVWLDEPNVSFCNSCSVLQSKSVVVPDLAIVIVALHLQPCELAFWSNVAMANCLSTALDCIIINSADSNSNDVCSR
jgi:hypothetical protein